jgi:hypothetical protein
MDTGVRWWARPSLLPAVGAAWLLFVAGSAGYLLHRQFYANRASQMWCSAGNCQRQIQPPGSVPGLILGVLAVGLLVAMIVVRNRNRLRWARWGMFAGLVAASWGAETMLFAPFFG